MAVWQDAQRHNGHHGAQCPTLQKVSILDTSRAPTVEPGEYLRRLTSSSKEVCLYFYPALWLILRVHWALPIHSFTNSHWGIYSDHKPKSAEVWEQTSATSFSLNQYCKTVPLTEGAIILISKCSTTFSWILSMSTILFLLFKGHLGTNFLSN